MAVPKAGDILILSQTACKIGRAFAAGQKDAKDAPSDFHTIETQAHDLAERLKRFAEVLHAGIENSAIDEAPEHVQQSIATAVDACTRTVHALDSLIDHDQLIKKHPTVGGLATEPSWSHLVLAEYASTSWTAAGGNHLHSLRHLLQMHTESIVLLTQAIQRQVNELTTKSQSRPETPASPASSASPASTHIHGINHHARGSLDDQLQEVLDLMQSLMAAPHNAQLPPIPATSPKVDAPNPLEARERSASSSSRLKHQPIPEPTSPQHIVKPSRSLASQLAINVQTPSSTETMLASKIASLTQKRVSGFSFGVSSVRCSSSSHSSSTASSSGGQSSPGIPLISQQLSSINRRSAQLSKTSEHRLSREPAGEGELLVLPSQAQGHATHLDLERCTSRTSLSPHTAAKSGLTRLHRSSTTDSLKSSFEKEAFRNAAVLCDVRGVLSEYSHQINEDDPRGVEMVRACGECRIAVVRKRVHDPETRAVRVVTSIWVFSDDNTTRMELRMDDEQMYIPYSSYFSLEKVSITVPCELKFHHVQHGNRPAKLAKTTWVNYVFVTPEAAVLFQNELMGRTLLATFRTEKTMRIHEGIGRSFSYAEQMCGLENLRVWEDNDTGAIIALIHFSADFRNGYLAFYLNSSTNPIKVKDDGDRGVKIKGLRVPVDRDDRAVRKGSIGSAKEKSKPKEEVKKAEKEKVISGAKIVFASEAKKREFMDMCLELQREAIELPDLLGVN
ncbi:hypothetical protein ACEQ8H_000410 [Pleosporales sp. CAS-2024a]